MTKDTLFFDKVLLFSLFYSNFIFDILVIIYQKDWLYLFVLTKCLVTLRPKNKMDWFLHLIVSKCNFDNRND